MWFVGFGTWFTVASCDVSKQKIFLDKTAVHWNTKPGGFLWQKCLIYAMLFRVTFFWYFCCSLSVLPSSGEYNFCKPKVKLFFFPNDCREYKNTPFTKLPSNIHFKFQSCLYVIFIPVDDWSNMNAGNWNGESAVLNVHLCKYFYRNASPFLELHCLSLLHISQVVLLDL